MNARVIFLHEYSGIDHEFIINYMYDDSWSNTIVYVPIRG